MPPLAGADGEDLLPRMQGRQQSGVAYLETLDTQLGQGWSPLYGIRTDTHKYVRAPRPELYDLVADPKELDDLAAEQPELVARLDREIDRIHAAGRPLRMQGLPDAATRQQLESLGYVVAGGIDTDSLGVVEGIDPKDGRRTLKYSDDARTLAGLRDFAGALDKLGMVLGGGPHIDVRRAQLARKSGRLDESLAYADSCAAMAPGWSDCVMHRALTLWEMGRQEEAMETMRQAAALDPSDSDPLAHLGGFHLVRGEVPQASKMLEQALASREGNVEVFWRLAAVRIAQGRLEEADALLDRMPPDRLVEADVAAPVAAAEIEAGELDRARARLRPALDRAPGEQRLRMLWREVESRSAAASQDG
jgi:Flp pilus assembly protein TadD